MTVEKFEFVSSSGIAKQGVYYPL